VIENRILLVEGDDTLRHLLAQCVAPDGGRVERQPHEANIVEFFRDSRPALVVLAPSAARTWDCLRVARMIRRYDRTVPLMLIVVSSSESLAIAALRAGVNEYVRAPLLLNRLKGAVRRLLGPSKDVDVLSKPLLAGPAIVGESGPMREIRGQLVTLAAADATVLITGETGTGKELVAAVIHANSPRRTGRFVAINCAAIPDTLLESELFGYRRGSFTGAATDFGGRLQLAHRGSVFFDEIGDMSLSSQAKILRTADAKELQRLGEYDRRQLDLRIIVATNQDLEQLVDEGRFRSDLFFRLNVARVCMPPLRDHREDIPQLAEHCIGDLNHRFKLQVDGIAPDLRERLMAYDWPGNVRELRAVIEATFLARPNGVLSEADLPPAIRKRLCSHPPTTDRERVLEELAATNGNKTRAARNLRCSRMTLYRRLGNYDLPEARRKRHALTSPDNSLL
jgi:DNA-binding NtrC family response regulator